MKKSYEEKLVATAKLYKNGTTIFGNGKIVLHTNPPRKECNVKNVRKVTLAVCKALIKKGKTKRCEICWTIGEWANTMKTVRKLKEGKGLQRWM